MPAEIQQTLARLLETPAAALRRDASLDLDDLRSRFAYPEPLPAPAPPPDAPLPPVVPDAPHEDDARYAVTLSTMDRLLSGRRRRKQDAALNRFERDRKAWSEDRANALAHFELAQKRHARLLAEQDAAYEAALDAWRDGFVHHLRQLEARAA